MYNLISKVKNKINSKLFLLGEQEEILGKLNLSGFHFSTYLPHSTSSLKYSTLSSILNDVIINNRGSVIEFGSGISTIYLAKLAKMNNHKLVVTSVDDNESWIEIMKNILVKEDIAEYVNFIHSPLIKSELAINNNMWYDEEIIQKQIKNKQFDVVIVDGPMAYTKEIELSRFPALSFIVDYLLPEHSVILDDTNRKGEKKIVRMWELNHGYTFNKLTSSSHISFKGTHYNIV